MASSRCSKLSVVFGGGGEADSSRSAGAGVSPYLARPNVFSVCSYSTDPSYPMFIIIIFCLEGITWCLHHGPCFVGTVTSPGPSDYVRPENQSCAQIGETAPMRSLLWRGFRFIACLPRLRQSSVKEDGTPLNRKLWNVDCFVFADPCLITAAPRLVLVIGRGGAG